MSEFKKCLLCTGVVDDDEWEACCLNINCPLCNVKMPYLAWERLSEQRDLLLAIVGAAYVDDDLYIEAMDAYDAWKGGER